MQREEDKRARRITAGLAGYGHRLIAVAVLVLAGMSSAPAQQASAAANEAQTFHASSWVGTWAAAPMPAGSALDPSAPGTLENQTIRQIVHISVGGSRLRVRLSNEFGIGPLVIGEAHVALHGGGASIVGGSDRTLRFSNRRSVAIPAGASVLSDPLEFNVPALADLAVSIYVPNDSGPPTYHDVAMQTAYISGAGNFTGALTLPGSEISGSRFWLTGVEVQPRARVGAVVTFGGAVMEGLGSTPDANRRWPDLLSARLNQPHERPRMSVINAAIACNRVLRERCGPSGLERFRRDVLRQKGVTHVVVDLGLLDITWSTFFGAPEEEASADEIIAGLRRLVRRSHKHGLQILAATLTPVEASIFPGFFTPENEAKRQAVNEWMRSSGEFDGLIDVDLAVRDPARPSRLLPAYDSGDGLHPSDLGHEAIANLVDLSLLR